MKAAVFSSGIAKTPLVLDIPVPVANAGDVVVDVVVAPVLAYASEIISGQRPMLFELPFVPGTGRSVKSAPLVQARRVQR